MAKGMSGQMTVTSSRGASGRGRPAGVVSLQAPWYQGTKYGRIYGRPNRSRKNGSRAGRR